MKPIVTPPSTPEVASSATFSVEPCPSSKPLVIPAGANSTLEGKTVPHLPSPTTPSSIVFASHEERATTSFYNGPDSSSLGQVVQELLFQDPTLLSCCTNEGRLTLAQFVQQRLLSSCVDVLNDVSWKLSSERLGHGAYSLVHGLHRAFANDSSLAVKFPISRRKSRIIYKESLIYSYLNSSSDSLGNVNIVPFYGVSLLGKSQYRRLRYGEVVPGIILAKMDCSLQDFYSAHVMDKQTWWKLAYTLLRALYFLKTKNVVHGDIKTGNVLLKIEDGDVQFYLADFTSAKLFPRDLHDTAAPGDCDSLITTLEYCPPELIDGSGSMSYSTDLYSLGLVLLSAITRNEPYKQLLSLKNHGDMRTSNTLHQTQWLMTAISKATPLQFNVLDHSLKEEWTNELEFLKELLEDRCGVEKCLSKVEGHFAR